MDILEIMSKYTNGEAEIEDTNKALKQAGATFHLEPGKNDITESDMRATTIGHFPDQANGYGLLDTGTGSLDKVQVKDGKLVDCDCGDMYALFFIAGRMYHVDGSALTE